MVTALQESVSQQEVIFYHAAGRRADAAGGGKYPSCMKLRVSGGERVMGANGIPCVAPMKEIQFVNGRLATSDPEVIAALRKLAKSDPSITEDYETYAGEVLTKDQQIARQARKNEEVMRENSRLQKKLDELQGRKSRE